MMPCSLSVVIPVHNESENIGKLLLETAAALRGVVDFEVVVVDDASADATAEVLRKASQEMPELRVLRHRKQAGQSAGVVTGVRASHGAWIATLDGDGQNDPSDIPAMLSLRDATPGRGSLLVAGRRRKRKDTAFKRMQSRIANAVRSRLLGDATPDTGCGLKLFPRDAFLALPHFDHVHRFLPALFLRAGGRVVSQDVSHRPRQGGTSHYGMWGRLAVGVVDLLGVMWLQRRGVVVEADEQELGVGE